MLESTKLHTSTINMAFSNLSITEPINFFAEEEILIVGISNWKDVFLIVTPLLGPYKTPFLRKESSKRYKEGKQGKVITSGLKEEVLNLQ